MYLTNAAILFISKVSGLWGQILKRPQVRPEEVKSLFVSQSDENPYPGPDLNDEYAIISSHGMMCLDFPGYTIIKHLYTGKRNDINMLVTKIKADPFEKILEEAQRRGLTVKVLTPKDLNAQYKIEKRTRYIQVRLNDYELMIIEKKAKENGMNKSEYLRKVALGELVP